MLCVSVDATVDSRRLRPHTVRKEASVSGEHDRWLTRRPGLRFGHVARRGSYNDGERVGGTEPRPNQTVLPQFVPKTGMTIPRQSCSASAPNSVPAGRKPSPRTSVVCTMDHDGSEPWPTVRTTDSSRMKPSCLKRCADKMRTVPRGSARRATRSNLGVRTPLRSSRIHTPVWAAALTCVNWCPVCRAHALVFDIKEFSSAVNK